MSTAASPRHNHLKQRIPVGKLPVGKRNAHKEEKMNEEKIAESAPAAGKLFAFTIDASTAQVVKLETLDESGARHELSDEEAASLMQREALNRAILGTLLQRAMKRVPEDAASAPADPSPADRAASAHAN